VPIARTSSAFSRRITGAGVPGGVYQLVLRSAGQVLAARRVLVAGAE